MKYVCCICGKEHEGFGNNPWPVKNKKGEHFGPEERCCDECNSNVVIPERIYQIYNKKTNS